MRCFKSTHIEIEFFITSSFPRQTKIVSLKKKKRKRTFSTEQLMECGARNKKYTMNVVFLSRVLLLIALELRRELHETKMASVALVFAKE